MVHCARPTTVARARNEEASYRTCPECDRVLYFSLGPPFLFPAPPADATIFESASLGLIVPQEIALRAQEKNWRRLCIDELPLPATPPDGYGILSAE